MGALYPPPSLGCDHDTCRSPTYACPLPTRHATRNSTIGIAHKEKASILQVHHDEAPPYYTILADGVERGTESERLSRLRGETAHLTEPPPHHLNLPPPPSPTAEEAHAHHHGHMEDQAKWPDDLKPRPRCVSPSR